MVKTHVLLTVFVVSVFFNITMLAVLVNNEEYISQQDYAIQYLGDETNSNKVNLDMLDDYRNANEALMKHCSSASLTRAVKASPLPPIGG